jgi:hypothetical protein
MVGGIGGSALSAALFLFRDQCEPILRLLVPLLVGRRSHFHYDPEDYYFFASLAVVMTLVWISLTNGLTPLCELKNDGSLEVLP